MASKIEYNYRPEELGYVIVCSHRSFGSETTTVTLYSEEEPSKDFINELHRVWDFSCERNNRKSAAWYKKQLETRGYKVIAPEDVQEEG